jgi:hypothetical protein
MSEQEKTEHQQVAAWLASVLRTASIPMGEARNAVHVEQWLARVASGELDVVEVKAEAA